MSNSGTPLVSIVVPCYNHAHYLEECLRSLQAQTVADWEAIIINDSSPDAPLIQPVLDRVNDSRVRLVSHDRNRGLAASRNTGFREARAQFVLPVDADDKLEPDCLESLIPVLTSDDSVDCVYADVRLFGRREDILEFPGPPPGEKILHPEHTIPGAGTMIRRQLWERLGGYDEHEELRRGREDFEFWIRAFKQGCEARRVPKPLYLYRILHTSMSLECYHEDDAVANYIREKNADVFDSPQQVRDFLSYFYQRAAIASYDKHLHSKAFRLAWQAWRLSPSKDRLVSVGKTALPPSWVRGVRRGEVRRYVPFLGYPLRGTQRFNPFFIIGVARSGNTLFRRILTSHSRLHIPPETFVLGETIQKFQRFGGKMSWPDLVRFVFSQFEFHPEFHTFDIRLEPLVNSLLDLPRRQRNLAFILNSFYRYHARMHEQPVQRWGDKTPMNSLDDSLVRGDLPRRPGEGVPENLLRIRKVFPDAQFLHIYRDGCDVVYSFLRGGFVANLEEAATRWLHTVRQTRNFVQRYPDACFSVRYEELVRSPEKTIRDVCDFLGETFEPEMLTSHDSAAKLGDVPAWVWHKQVGEPINSANPGKGRVYFSREQKARLQSLIGDELESLGYAGADEELLENGKAESRK